MQHNSPPVTRPCVLYHILLQQDDGGVNINYASDRLFCSGLVARSDAPCIHTDHPGYIDSGVKASLMPHQFRNAITNRGVSGSEGGMLAKVDLVSVAVELDDLVESVELLAALGGGQSGGNSSLSWLSLSSCFLAKVFASFGYRWAYSMRVLLAV
eukprot:scaffold79600_cov65-Attheya_sp.AAC.3